MFFLLAIEFQNQSNAQSSNLVDYVFVAGSPGCTNSSASNCGIVIGGNATIISGNIATPNQLSTSNGVELNGEIYTGNKVNLGNSVLLNGTVYVENSTNSSSFVLTSGNNFDLTENIYSGGKVKVNGGSVDGSVTLPTGSSYTGPAPSGGVINDNYSFNPFPDLPAPATMAAHGNGTISSSQTISPGSYGDIKLTGGKTLTFSGPGVYTFKSIRNKGSLNTFVYDF